MPEGPAASEGFKAAQAHMLTPAGQQIISLHPGLRVVRTDQDFNGPTDAAKLAPAQSAVSSKVDSDLAALARQPGAKASQGLDYLARNADSPQFREIARIFRDKGVDSKLTDQLPPLRAADQAYSDRLAQSGLKVEHIAHYDLPSDTIALGGATDMQANLLHEAAHAAYMPALNAKTQTAYQAQKLFEKVVGNTSEATYNDPALRNGWRNVHEFMSEAFSNPRTQDYLKTQHPGLWQEIKNHVFKALGMPERVRTAFDQVMDLGGRLADETRQLKLTDGRDPPPGQEPRVGSIPDALDMAPKLMLTADSAKAQADDFIRDLKSGTALRGVSNGFKKLWGGWAGVDALVAQWGHYFPTEAPAYDKAYRTAQTIRDHEVGAAQAAYAELHSAATKNPKGYDTFNNILAAQRSYIFDARAPLHQQPAEAGNPAEWSQAKRDAYKSARQQWGQISGAFAKSDDLMRQTGRQTLLTYISTVLGEVEKRLKLAEHLPGFEKDALADYVNHPEMMDAPAAKEQFFRDDVNAKIEGFSKYSAELKQKTFNELQEVSGLRAKAQAVAKRGDDAGAKALNDQADTLLKTRKPDSDYRAEVADNLDDAIKDARKNLEKIYGTPDRPYGMPYSHLGRSGDYYVAMRLKTDDKGVTLPQAQQKLQELAATAKFDNLVFNQNAENNLVYSRFKNPTQSDNFRAMVADKLQEAGLLAPSSGEERALHSGMVSDADADALLRNVAPKYIARLIKGIDFARLPEDQRLSAQRQLTATMLDLYPSDSLTHTQQRSEGILGFDKDMGASFQHYVNAHAFGVSALWKASRVSDALAGMADRVDRLKAGPDRAGADTAQIFLRELAQRETKNPWRAPSTIMQGLLQLNHAYFLTLSPAYVAELMTQIPVLMLPQIGRDHGYAAATQAIFAKTAEALKVTGALLASGRGADALLTPAALKGRGLSQSQIDFHMDQANRGNYELGGWTHANQSDSPSLAKNHYMQMAQTMTVAAEVFPRILAALAAKHLYELPGGADKARTTLDNYVTKSVDGSMLNWQSDMQARHLGRGGFAGPMTPLVTKFMSYQTKLMNKLYIEANTAFGSLAAKESQARVERGEIPASKLAEETKAARDSARKFLLGHLAAVTVLAGSLGLPILPVAASAASSLANFFGGTDKYDAEKWYREHLNQTFGDQFGEAIAKGLPRIIPGLPMDLSEHAGEDRLLPFSDMLTDKRKWSDVLTSAAWRSLGSPFSMIGNGIKGATDIANGRVLKGVQEVLPSGAKNLVKAYRMNQFGYENDSGVKLPISDPETKDIMLQAVGITPANKARQQEGAEALQSLHDRRAIVTNNLAANLVTAFNHRDNDAMRAALQSYQGFNADHPGAWAQPGQVLSKALHQQMLGRAFGELGVNPRDLAQQETLRAYGMMPAH